MIAELHSQAIISFLNYYYLCYDLSLSHVAAKLPLFTELTMVTHSIFSRNIQTFNKPPHISVEFSSTQCTCRNHPTHNTLGHTLQNQSLFDSSKLKAVIRPTIVDACSMKRFFKNLCFYHEKKHHAIACLP